MLRRWLGPSALAVLAVLIVECLIALPDWRADWAFLHAARQQAIQRAVTP